MVGEQNIINKERKHVIFFVQFPFSWLYLCIQDLC